MATIDDLRAAKRFLGQQVLQLGLGGRVVRRRATMHVSSASSFAGRSVHAIGIGRKVAAGASDRELCVRLYVVQKLPQSLLAPRDRLPESIDGIPTDVVEAAPGFVLAKRAKARRTRGTGSRAATRSAAAARISRTDTLARAASNSQRSRQRPVIAGISAGHRDITVGTIACFCRSLRVGDDPTRSYVLSNNHIFANVNRGLIGDPLYQPGPSDGGGFESYFANLHRYVEIFLGGTIPNRVDAAIGSVLSSIEHRPEILGLGSLVGTGAAAEGMAIRKQGRTTGLTEGTIDDIEYDALIGMDHNDPNQVALFHDQLRVIPSGEGAIGLGGDSGSAILDAEQNVVVGLYFAGPPTGTYGVANKIQNVFAELEIGLP